MKNNSTCPGAPATGYQSLEIKKLTPHPEASKLFQVEPELLESISSEMKEKGFKGDRPISAVKDSEGNLFVYDGNTRLNAAKKAGLTEVPVYVNEELDAADNSGIILEAVKDQTKRRQNIPATFLIAVEAFYEKESLLAKERMARNLASMDATPGKASGKIAQALGISSASVERLLKIMKDAQVRADTLAGKYDSVRAAYDAVKAKGKADNAKPCPKKAVQPGKTNPEGDIDIDSEDAEIAYQEAVKNGTKPVEEADDEDEAALSFLISSGIMRKILALISEEMQNGLRRIEQEAHSPDLSKLIAERIKSPHKAA